MRYISKIQFDGFTLKYLALYIDKADVAVTVTDYETGESQVYNAFDTEFDKGDIRGFRYVPGNLVVLSERLLYAYTRETFELEQHLLFLNQDSAFGYYSLHEEDNPPYLAVDNLWFDFTMFTLDYVDNVPATVAEWVAHVAKTCNFDDSMHYIIFRHYNSVYRYELDDIGKKLVLKLRLLGEVR